MPLAYRMLWTPETSRLRAHRALSLPSIVRFVSSFVADGFVGRSRTWGAWRSIDGLMPLLSNPNVESYILEETAGPLSTAFPLRHMGRDAAAALPSGGFRALQGTFLFHLKRPIQERARHVVLRPTTTRVKSPLHVEEVQRHRLAQAEREPEGDPAILRP